ncbi:DeoR/GlpR family DNA-binding transcription regulator [Oceanobacillus massiliensis]|uniref:DeoR/GlpR family DNA-binding transcription regulator n=1 Tax=Oceanobacillus massiliensis TaxID=1465765 RepID=UPI000289AB00|nr:DeoR/GlpR family DNA-binding transcription regulator [Oceanobacillus massiliensis]
MITEERHSFILSQLNENGLVKSADLMDELNCSESTIRRDLANLEKSGALMRIHGGAKRIYQLDKELSYNEKTVKNVHNKNLIGKFAASLIEDNDVIYMDAGTTTLAMIHYINAENITVVTNGLLHASLLADRNIYIIQLGGSVKNSTKAIIGANSLSELQNYRFTKAFLGTNGIDITFGCTTPDPEEASIKALAHHQSSVTYVLADESKWNKVNFAKVCSLEEVSIITDKVPRQQQYHEKTIILEASQ